MKETYKKILLIELAGIGDAVLSTPMIRNLRNAYPDAFIYYLCFPGPSRFIKKSPYLNKIFTIHKGFSGFFYNIIVLNNLRNMRIDVAINLYQHYTFIGAIKMNLLLKSINAKKNIGRNTDGKGFFYDVRIEDRIETGKHEVEYKLDLARSLDCEIKDKKLEVYFDDCAEKKAEKFLENNSISNSDILIGINPGGNRQVSLWDPKNFSNVAEALIKKYNAKIIITGSKKESILVKKIRQNMSFDIIDATIMSLEELAVLIKRFRLYISNNTGPMHIANALEVPLISIEGGVLFKTAPYQKDKCIILRKHIECSPCYKQRCSSMKCLKMISPEEVIQASIKLLEDKKI
ncbi:MAG: glycosyltransferase family 9 protein [Candidatus Omnitrophota bacterium]